MLWGDWNVCVIESPRSSLDKRRIFRKSPRPSLPLKRAPPFSPSLSSMVFTPPSGPPFVGDRNPQGRENVTALQCYICPTCPSPAGGSLTHSQALALSKRARDVTALLGARNRYALWMAGHQSPRQILCGMGPPYYSLLR